MDLSFSFKYSSIFSFETKLSKAEYKFLVFWKKEMLISDLLMLIPIYSNRMIRQKYNSTLQMFRADLQTNEGIHLLLQHQNNYYNCFPSYNIYIAKIHFLAWSKAGVTQPLLSQPVKSDINKMSFPKHKTIQIFKVDV